MNTNPETTQLPFETLRLRAEADIKARVSSLNPQMRRPCWAPPLVLEGELLQTCIELGRLTAEDKPVARLWARFADPKQLGRTLREANHDQSLAMPGISCCGFDLFAGNKRGRKTEVLLYAQRRGAEGRTGPDYYVPPAPSLRCDDGFMRRRQLLKRAVELALIRIAEFAGNYDMQTQLAGRVSGHCCECGRGLTDPQSVERGIGPDCLATTLCVALGGGFVRLTDAITDGRIAAEGGILRWVSKKPAA